MKFPKRNLKKKSLKFPAPKKTIRNAVNKAKVDNIKKIVKSVVLKSSERKFAMKNYIADKVSIYGAGLNYNGTTNLNGWCSGPSDGYGIIPLVPAGTGEGNRIGVKIATKGFFLRYSLNALFTTDAASGANPNPFKGVPFRVRVIVFRHKYAIDDYSQSNICNVGNGNADLGSDLDTYFRPYNKDEYTIVYSRTHKMAALRHSSTANTTENMPPGCQNIVIGRTYIKLPRILRYNDTLVTNSPTNVQYYLACAVVNDDGSAISTSQSRVILSAETGMYFHDA